MDENMQQLPLLVFGELFPQMGRIVMRDFISSKTKEHHLSSTQIKTLHVLSQHGSSPMSMLGRATGLEKGSMTSVIDNLVDRGFVTRSRPESDRRKVLVELTENGRHVAGCLIRQMQEDLDRKLSLLPEKQRNAFYKALCTLKLTMDTLERELHEHA
jgi:DNA-binding MarR family transcriptional regulator